MGQLGPAPATPGTTAAQISAASTAGTSRLIRLVMIVLRLSIDPVARPYPPSSYLHLLLIRDVRHKDGPAELLLDLVFAFAFTQVTTVRSDHPTCSGLEHGLLILAALRLGSALDLPQEVGGSSPPSSIARSPLCVRPPAEPADSEPSVQQPHGRALRRDRRCGTPRDAPSRGARCCVPSIRQNARWRRPRSNCRRTRSEVRGSVALRRGSICMSGRGRAATAT